MIKSFFWCKEKIILAYGGLFILVYLLQVQVHYSVMINAWREPFWNMMQNVSAHTLVQFLWQIWAFCLIAMPYVLVASLTSYCTRVYGFEWRQAITFNYLPRWRNVKEKIEGESQRIQEDTQRFASIVESLLLQVISAIMTLIAFMPVLWEISKKVDIGPTVDLIQKGFAFLPEWVTSFYFALENSFQFRVIVTLLFIVLFLCGTLYIRVQEGQKRIREEMAVENGIPALIVSSHKATAIFITLVLMVPFLFLVFISYLPPLKEIPGILVWIALTTSLGGMIISWFVGIRLPGLEYNNQVVEARFRKELVLAEDNKEVYGTVPTVTELFFGIRHNYFRLFNNYTYFNIWGESYNQIMVVLPYIVIGPGLFTGIISLGILTKAASAFSEVNGSCSILINNWTRVTELRSIWRRLHEFEAKMDKYNNV
jgi:ABC-type long-subunit fatty acid transport system fused permease/ATPase subunit